MTTKKVPAKFAPAKNSDPDFEEYVKRVLEGLAATGNPEGIDEETVRERTARAFVKYGGKTFTPASDDDDLPWPDEPIDQVRRELRIPAVPEAYWYEDPEQAEVIEHFILMRRALGSAFHGGLLITGGAGYGKTLGMSHLVDRMNRERNLNLRLFRMNCAVQTDPGKWFGRREIDKNGTRYEKSDLILAIERGDIVQLDEVNRIHPHIADSVHSLLDGTQELVLPDLNLTIQVPPTAVFVATMNIGSQYGGTHRLDHAFRTRFSTTIEVGPPPRDEEVRVVHLNTGCDMDAASNLVDIAVKSRQMFETGDLRAEISTRDLVAAGRWVAAGKTEREALLLTAVPLFDGDSNGVTAGSESDRAKVMAIIQGRLGK